jgi:hypothetical protein
MTMAVGHWSVRPCQKVPSSVRSYSSRLTQGWDVLPSLVADDQPPALGDRAHPPHGHRHRTGHGATRPAGVVVDTLVNLGHHGALAAAATGDERKRRGGGDERAEHGPISAHRRIERAGIRPAPQSRWTSVSRCERSRVVQVTGTPSRKPAPNPPLLAPCTCQRRLTCCRRFRNADYASQGVHRRLSSHEPVLTQ